MKKKYILLIASALLVFGLQSAFADGQGKIQRIEMNGFSLWTQGQIDSLLKEASHIGNSITDLSGGYKANDFTKNTEFTVKNGVFTMTAKADFTGENGMGFKNADREGKLAGTALGDYPANFFCDLTNAEGIRFKIDITSGTVKKLNIGLSNCANACFEYFVNGISTEDVDEEGYVTLPFAKFQREFWSAEGLQLNNLKVFIIEAIDATNGASISFSDVHGYKTIDPHGELTLSIDGKTEICEGDVDTLKAISDATEYVWSINYEIVSTEKYWVVPAAYMANTYPVYVEAKRINEDSTVTTTSQKFDLHIFAADSVVLTDTAFVGIAYDKNGFNITPEEIGTQLLYDTLVNQHGCDSLITLKLIVVEKTSGIAHYESAVVGCYPNPTNGLIFIQLASRFQNSQLFLYDLQGRLVMTQWASGETISLNLEQLNSGVYLLKVENQTVKIIKR